MSCVGVSCVDMMVSILALQAESFGFESRLGQLFSKLKMKSSQILSKGKILKASDFIA